MNASTKTSVVTNAGSTGIRIDRKQLKSLARRSDRPGLIYLALWMLALALTGALVWFTLGTAFVWGAMFVFGVVMGGAVLRAQPRDGARNGLPHTLAQRDGLLVHVAALRRGAAASALHPHEPPHAHLVRGPRQPDALRHAAHLQGLALRHQRAVGSQVPVSGALAARDEANTRR